jgi:hypothetical protein
LQKKEKINFPLKRMPSNFFLNNFENLINIKIISFSTLYFMNKYKILNHKIMTIQNKIFKIPMIRTLNPN